MLAPEGGGYAKRVALAVAEQQGTPPGGTSWHVVFCVTCPCDRAVSSEMSGPACASCIPAYLAFVDPFTLRSSFSHYQVRTSSLVA